MEERSLIIALSIAFFITQIVYFFISKSSTNRIVSEVARLMKELSPHFERVRKVEDMVVHLKAQHDAVDPDTGRPMWYVPHALSATQKEILSLTLETSQILANINEKMDKSLNEQNSSAKALDRHRQRCVNQFETVDKKMDQYVAGVTQ